MQIASQAFIEQMIAPVSQVKVKLQLLDNNDNVIEEITPRLIEGSISVDKDRDIRRTATLTIENSDNLFTWGEDKLIWLDKRFKLFVGFGAEYIPQGVFVVTNPEALSRPAERIVTIQGNDKAYLLAGSPIGKFVNETTIQKGVKIGTAIKQLAEGISKFLFDNCDVTVPYDLTYSAGEARWKAMKELADLAVYTLYFDTNGYLRFRPQRDLEKTPPCWTYKPEDYTLYAGSNKRLDDSELCNHILVIGGSSQTATVTAEAKDDDPDSPTSIQRIGSRLYIHGPDPLITTKELAQARADYELQKRLAIAERVDLELVPNYLHEAEDVIELIDPNNEINDRYELVRFTIPLRAQKTQAEAVRIRRYST